MMYLSLGDLALEFGLPPVEISQEEYREKSKSGWVEWVPATGPASHGHDLVVITPPGTSHLRDTVSKLIGQEVTLG